MIILSECTYAMETHGPLYRSHCLTVRRGDRTYMAHLTCYDGAMGQDSILTVTTWARGQDSVTLKREELDGIIKTADFGQRFLASELVEFVD